MKLKLLSSFVLISILANGCGTMNEKTLQSDSHVPTETETLSTMHTKAKSEINPLSQRLSQQPEQVSVRNWIYK